MKGFQTGPTGRRSFLWETESKEASQVNQCEFSVFQLEMSLKIDDNTSDQSLFRASFCHNTLLPHTHGSLTSVTDIWN